MKKLLSTLTLLALIFGSPIIMDHARDIYLEEIVSPKAMPVKIGNRIIASSWQLSWKGKRVTVTNNHVCSAMKRRDIQNIKRRILKLTRTALVEYFLGNTTEASISGFQKELGILEALLKKTLSEGVVGKTLKIGDINRKILYNSPNHDICFLEPVGSKSFSLASSVHRGERISIIGHPRGVAQSISDGRIVGSAYQDFSWLPKAGRVRYLRSTAITYPGNSGSPVINRYGNVVGILFAGTSIDYLNVNCVVPLEYIESELESYFEQK